MALNDSLLKHLDEIYNKCLSCGLCLPTCPTYNLNLREESSPRGRIKLMYSIHHDKIPLTKLFVDEMYFCLDCQACETICPAGVRFGELVEEARNMIDRKNQEPLKISLFKKIFLDYILSSPERTKKSFNILKLYQKSGLKEAVDQSGILKVFSEKLHFKHQLLPTVDHKLFNETVAEVLSLKNGIRGRVALLSGCIMNAAFTKIHRDTVRVLLLNGFEVIIPKNQVCCGSLHAHNGEIDLAKKLAIKNIEVFEKYEFDSIIVDSGGCGAFMKEYGRILEDNLNYKERAKVFSSKVKDITEFLIEVGLTREPKTLNKKVTYHEACHLVHTQKISLQPRQLIKLIPGVELIELPESSWCCGSAGIYNIIRFEDSMKILERKMMNIKSTNSDVVVTANPGCHLQIQFGIKKNGLKMEVMHPVSLLSMAYH